MTGKGGVGKTVLAALLARCLAERGLEVLAVDLDTNPGLALSLGLPADARWALQVTHDLGVGRVLVVANRVRGEADIAYVRESLPAVDVVAVPDDPAIAGAERRGLAPLDAAPTSPAVHTVQALAHGLLEHPA